jgi:hypothetical protein
MSKKDIDRHIKQINEIRQLQQVNQEALKKIESMKWTSEQMIWLLEYLHKELSMYRKADREKNPYTSEKYLMAELISIKYRMN